MARKGIIKLLSGLRKIKKPKFQLSTEPWGVMVDSAGGYHVVTPKPSLSFTTGGGRRLSFDADDLVYGPSAGGKLRELQNAAGGKLLSDIGGPYDFGFGNDWAKFSLATLDDALRKGKKIHFDLTHMKNLEGILKGTAHQSKTTTKELLHLRSNWSSFKDNVLFYRNGEVVSPPWLK